MQKSFIITVVLCAVVGSAVAEENNTATQLPRPSDITMERGDRPQRPLAHVSSGLSSATLMQTEVVRLAKSAAKKEKGRTFDDYHLRSVIFDPNSREWTVSFNPKPPRLASAECLLVIVKDDTRQTNVLRC
jgi:hypothetical protein